MAYYVGVDLGTTFTAAAVWRRGRVEVASLGMRAPVVPSVVLPRADGTTLVGEPAERRGAAEPERVAREFKRRFGDTTPLILGGAPWSADALTARLLAWAVGRVAEAEGGPPDGVVVCHPANWGEFKKDLLRQAVARADLGVPTTLVAEPEAAAIYYATENRVAPGAIVAVYDLGGGTFDAAVLRRTDPGWEVLGEPQGVERLGGIDFDEAVFRHVVATLGLRLEAVDGSDPASLSALARLRRECVEAKEALSADADVTIPVLLPSLQHDVRLTRAELEEMMRPALVDTIAALRRTLRTARVSPEDVHSVLLVGGSSRVPLVGEMVGSALGRPVAIDAHPKHGTALGAAVLAAERATAGRAETREVEPRTETPRPTAAVPLAAPAPAPADPPAPAPDAPPTPEAAAPPDSLWTPPPGPASSDPTPTPVPADPPPAPVSARRPAPPAPATPAEPEASPAGPAPGPTPAPERPAPPSPSGDGAAGPDGRPRRRGLLVACGVLAVGALVAGAIALRGGDDGDGDGGSTAEGTGDLVSEDSCASGDDRTVTPLDDIVIPAVAADAVEVEDVQVGGETVPGFYVDAVDIPEQVVDGGCIIEFVPSGENCLGAVEITGTSIPGVDVGGYEIPAAPGDDGDFEGQSVAGTTLEGASVDAVRVEEVCADESNPTAYRDEVVRSELYRDAAYREAGYRPELCVDGECADQVDVPELSIDEVYLPEARVDSKEISV